jgi:hypothetical protein
MERIEERDLGNGNGGNGGNEGEDGNGNGGEQLPPPEAPPSTVH